MKIKSIITLLSLGLSALSFTGCDSGGSSDDDTPTGPSNSAAFVGTSISFNPTVAFEAGDNMTYTNNETNSPFPTAPTPTPGTYTYTPNANFTQGTLTLTVDSEVITLELSDFIHDSNDNITGFTARASGQSYPVTVTGTLPAHVSGDGNGPGESRADDIPATLRGTHSLVFFPGSSTADDLPDEGTVTTFVITARDLTFDGRTLTDPVFFNNDNSEWLFKDGSRTYGVSATPSGRLNEINVYGPIEAAGPTGSFGRYLPAEEIVLVSGQPTAGSFFTIVESADVPPTFPTTDVFVVGETETITFGPDVLTLDGDTYTFARTESPSGSDIRVLVYETISGSFVDIARVRITTAGQTDYFIGVELERTRGVGTSAIFTFVPTGN